VSRVESSPCLRTGRESVLQVVSGTNTLVQIVCLRIITVEWIRASEAPTLATTKVGRIA